MFIYLPAKLTLCPPDVCIPHFGNYVMDEDLGWRSQLLCSLPLNSVMTFGSLLNDPEPSFFIRKMKVVISPTSLV